MERPILFSGEMIRAILDGRKTMTRRVVTRVARLGPVREFHRTSTPGYDWIMRDQRWLWNDLRHDDLIERCPHGAVGTKLWVREAWCEGTHAAPDGSSHRIVFYRQGSDLPQEVKWRPSIHMPRWASRIDLEVTAVRVERLQEISEEDARAEGMRPLDPENLSHRSAFIMLWDEINGDPRGETDRSWASNPWVWVVSFRRVRP